MNRKTLTGGNGFRTPPHYSVLILKKGELLERLFEDFDVFLEDADIFLGGFFGEDLPV